MPLKPRHPVPDLKLPLVGGGQFDLRSHAPQAFSLLVFYRGLHCPICRRYITELQEKLPQFEELGVKPVSISSDTRERAEQSAAEWGLKRLPVAWGLSIAQARDWDLYISSQVRPTDPPLFNEPGFVLARPDMTLQYIAVSNSPWGRPPIAEMLTAVDAFIKNNVPPRGEA
jgi:alkyl hydroperoxide reductase subunit AhpC